MLQLERPRRPVRIGLTPLIDVVFILLLFFMLSSTFDDHRRIDLETPTAAAQPNEAEVLVVALQADGYRIDGIGASPEVVRDRIKVLVARDASSGVIIRVGDGVALSRMIAAVDLINGAGAQRFSLQPES